MDETISFAVRRAGNPRALVLIHGFSGDSHQTFGMLPAFLAGSPALYGWDIQCFGYPTSLCPDITGVWSADPDLTTLAGLLNMYLNDGRYAGYEEVVLVAHSMGGLVAQRAILDMPAAASARVHGLFLFGTPSNGLRKAQLLKRLFKRQVTDMAWGGDFITRLRNDWSSRFGGGLPFGFAAVAGVRDEFVPVASSLDPFPKEFRRYANGNHLDMVKPRNHEGDAVVLLLSLMGSLSAGGHTGKGLAPASVAGAVDQYSERVKLLGGREDSLPESELTALALALEMTGRQNEAVGILEHRHVGSTELTGVLAGRYKRRFLADPEEAADDGRRSLQLYRDAYAKATRKGDYPQAYYNGINAAFMTLAVEDDRVTAARTAGEVTEHCRAARGSGTADRWVTPTEAEAALHLGDTSRAEILYREALEDAFDERERGTMLRQGVWVTRLLEQSEAEARLAALYDPSAPYFPPPPHVA